MTQKEKSLTEMLGYVMHLRYRLALYQFDGIAPPEYLLNELKMAELLAKLDSEDAARINLIV